MDWEEREGGRLLYWIMREAWTGVGGGGGG